jgi:signal transduction histidine kinase
MKKKGGAMKKMSIILLIIVTISCFTTIIVNYYTIKILSASRAYINGESQYSKGEKEASRLLISYVYAENPENYNLFLKAINVPIGDRLAREALSAFNKDGDAIAQAGFLQAKNHPDDIDDMIWLFKHFQHLGLFANAIVIWKNADVKVEQLYKKGLSIHKEIDFDKITPADKKILIHDINQISNELTAQQQAFSDTLGIICRKINFGVFLLDVIVTVLIMGSIILFVWISMRNMQYSQIRIIEQNDSLQAVNAELDKVIYNVSHDLRSPLASLTGLINLIDQEDDMDQIRLYTSLMQKSVDKQGEFINDILLTIKNKKDTSDTKECNLVDIIEDVLSQNNYSTNGKKLRYYQEIDVKTIDCDDIKLKVILNNLISNAIKYSDPQKPDSWIKIRTYRLNYNCVIEVEDNGIGIKGMDKTKIFKKFYSGKQSQDSSGIGLYLTKDAVKQLGGSITVSSDYMIGSKFAIEIPYANS